MTTRTPDPVALERDTAAVLSERFRSIAQRARTEEDLRIGVESELRDALRVLGIEVQPRYEVTFLSGRADAVYGHAVLEYEAPGKLKTRPGYTETTSQLRNFLTARAREVEPTRPAAALKRMVGISLDGTSILFCQYRTAATVAEYLPGTQLSFLPSSELVEGFETRGPFEVTPESVSLMLGFLRAMSRPPLTARALTDEFGPNGDIARIIVPRLYSEIVTSPSDKALTFFSEWKRLFGIIYGNTLASAAKRTKRAKELAQLYGLDVPKPELLALLFSIHTYFSLLMKLFAIELLALQQGALVEPLVRRLAALPPPDLRDQLRQLEDGDIFAEYGITNFVEGDFFQWYLHPLADEVAVGIRRLVSRLDDFEPPSATIQPERAEDLLKELYQQLIPRSLRHDLGEYYTPDWLAEYLIDQAGYSASPDARVLDPSCGSGTFLVALIRRLRRECLRRGMPDSDIARRVLSCVVGFEINPLAVIASRTNYILALGHLVRHGGEFDIPVYFADSVLTPAKLAEVAEPLFYEDAEVKNIYRHRTVVGDFPIPAEVVSKSKMPALAHIIGDCLAVQEAPAEFVRRAMRELSLERPESGPALNAVYVKIAELEAAGLNGVWAKILKNAVAPLDAGHFDYVIGNPPWVQWEDLSPEYRDASAELWSQCGLVPGGAGGRFALGTTKRDFSMLFSYVASLNYLRDGGTLAFLITQTVFQSGTGSVFRRFTARSGPAFEVSSASDFVSIKPFDAQNWSGAIVWKKGPSTSYPIPYRLWKRNGGRPVRRTDTLSEVREKVAVVDLQAEPLVRGVSESPWLLALPGSHASLRRLQGRSTYRASSGIVTWLDPVYWVRVVEDRGDGTVVVENLWDAGKTAVRRVRRVIERDLLYPFVPWSAIERWRATPTHSILIPHDLGTGYLAISEKEMRANYRRTLAYFYLFKDQLEARSGYMQLRSGHPFYILGNTGTAFRAPYKVVWRSMGNDVRAAVLATRQWNGVPRPEVHKNTVNFVPFEQRDEALYVCGLLNSSFVTTYALASSVRGGKGFAGVNLLDSIRIPVYNSSDGAHRAVVAIADAAVNNPRADDRGALDQAAAAVWNITPSAIQKIRETAAALR